jgi:predicted dehydrogenase
MNRKLRMGMVGGGPGAFIGNVHRKAACLDGGVELLAGCFSRTVEKSKSMAAELYLDASRCYPSYLTMIEEEVKRPEGDRIDFVSVVTPNVSHFEISKAFLEAGFHVIQDKPMTFNLEQAVELEAIVERTGLIFALTHNYTGYPMVKLARDMIKQGRIGKVLKITVQYPQGWLARPVERAVWRTDPAISGAAGCMGDIGTHAENLAEYITGLQMTEICADLSRFGESRSLDDDGSCLVHFEGGARGLLYASQISIGELNSLAIAIHGAEGAIKWEQEHPDELLFLSEDGTVHIYRRGTGAVTEISSAAKRATRLPAGHPEGFIEAFANIYKNAADTIRAAIEGREPTELELDFPTVTDGVRGMKFIDGVVSSNGSWVKL